MSRISTSFQCLKREGRKALVTFITAGDPDLQSTVDLVPVLAEAGADIVELGVPFSDPMADGPAIQLSSERALAAGTTLPGILASVKKIREKCEVPILLMGYFNPVFLYGVEKFATDAAAAGVDGVLIVDLPPEEAAQLSRHTAAAGIDLIYLLTPTSDDSRISKVARIGTGFVYYVSVTGVTGERAEISRTLAAEVAAVKEKAGLPVAVGFGISTPEQAAHIASFADGVVVGSAIVRLFEGGSDGLSGRVSAFVSSLRAALG